MKAISAPFWSLGLVLVTSLGASAAAEDPCFPPESARGMPFADATLQAALLSNHSYKHPPELTDNPPTVPNSGKPPIKYEIVDYEPRGDAGGFAAVAYRNPVTGETIIAFRGTEPTDVLDLAADVGIGAEALLPDSPLGRVGPFAGPALALIAGRRALESQIRGADAFTERVRKKASERRPPGEVSLTGHSLGGGLAQFEAARTGLPAHTFNAPGMGKVVERRISPAQPERNVFNHARGADAVHYATGDRHGAGIDYESVRGLDGLNPLQQHSIDNFEADLRRGLAPKGGWPPACSSGTGVPAPPSTPVPPSSPSPAAAASPSPAKPSPSPAKSPPAKASPTPTSKAQPGKPCPKGIFTLCGAIPTKSPGKPRP